MKRLYIGILVFLSALFMVQAQESGTRSPKILALDFSYSGEWRSIDVSGCTALTILTCVGDYYARGQLSSIDASGCTALTLLFCYNNQLSSIDVSGCTALTTLNCMYNQLTELDVSSCTALTSLYCDNNQLTELDVSGRTSLTDLSISSNSSLLSLNASGCTSLTRLAYVYTSQLSSLDVSGCTALRSLDCSYSYQLSSLDVSGCTALKNLNCSDKQLSSLDVSGCTALTSLYCSNNRLSSLDVSSCTALTSLSCYSNQLSSIDVSANKVLTSLYCGGNQLSSIDVSANTALTSLSCGSNQLSSIDVSANKVLTSLYCGGNQLSSIDVSANTALTSLDCDNNQLSSLDVSANTALKSLSCDNNQLSSLDVSANTALTSLDCDNNQLSSLDVSANTALKSLSCDNNQLSSLDVSGCTALTSLSFRSNRLLLSLNASGCTALTSLNWSGSYDSRGQLSSIDMSGCTSLRSLSCDYNQLSSIDVSGCTALTSLSCYNNQLNSIDVSGCTALTSLDCDNNQLSSINVSGCTALTSLDCRYNQLSSLDVSANTALTSLDCRYNQLSSLDVSANTALMGLYCSNNQLSSIDVSVNTALWYLYCSNNQLSSIDVSANTALRYLNCSYNQLSILDVSANTALSSLYCEYNRIPLAMLHKAYSQRRGWSRFSAAGQSDSIIVWINRSLDLSSEGILWQPPTTISLTDAYGGSVSSDFWTENGFVFQFHKPGNYRLKLTNAGIGSGADFTWHVSVEVSYYTVQVVCHNPEWGTATMMGNGTYEEGSQVTITATPKEGYRFVNWTKKDGSVFATEAVHTFTVTENMELTANFEEVPRYTVEVACNNSGWGTATMMGNGTYEEGSQVTITATPNNGYRFVNWTEKDGSVFTTEAIHTFAVTENLELTANFEEVPRYTVDVACNNSGWGAAAMTGNGTYEEGSQVTITATPKEGYRFVNWTRKDGTVFTTEAVHTFTVTENVELMANFEEVPEEVETFTVVLMANNAGWGSVYQTGEGAYEEGKEITIIATPKEGYRFVNWTRKDGSVFATEVVHTFTVTENVELTANFEKIPEEVKSFTVVLASNNNAYGSVSQSGNGTYEEGSQATITATPNDGYRFVNWTRKNGSVFSTEAVHTFTVTENMELTANFEKKPDVANESRGDDGFYVYVQDHTIHLSAGRGVVRVYNAAGVCVYSGESTAIPVQSSGLYIVRIGERAYKAMVR